MSSKRMLLKHFLELFSNGEGCLDIHNLRGAVGVNNSSHVSQAKQVSLVEIIPSPKGTVFWFVMLPTMLSR